MTALKARLLRYKRMTSLPLLKSFVILQIDELVYLRFYRGYYLCEYVDSLIPQMIFNHILGPGP